MGGAVGYEMASKHLARQRAARHAFSADAATESTEEEDEAPKLAGRGGLVRDNPDGAR